MLKNEFIENQRQEIVKDDPKPEDVILNELLKLIEECLSVEPNDFEIEDKSVKDCYKQMETYAKEHQINNCYCFSEKQTKQFINDYFKIDKVQENTRSSDFVNLSDFI